jgi:trigger factor
LETNLVVLEGCRRELTITMTAGELQPHFEKAYIAAQPELQLPGFRKGKVPLGMVKKNFGRDIENRAMEDIASAAFNEAIQSQESKPVGQPTLRDIQRENDGTVGFVIAFDVLPEITLGEYRNIAINKPVREIGEEDVEREIEEMSIRFGTTEPAENVSDDKHIVTVRLRQLDEQTGMPLLGAQADEFPIFMRDTTVNPTLRAQLRNASVSDTFNFTPPAQPSRDPNIPPVKPSVMQVSVEKIDRIVPAEFTNELVENFTNGELLSTEEYREQILRDLKTNFTQSSRRSMEDQLVNAIVTAHTFDVPQGLVQEILVNMVRDIAERQPDGKLPKDFDVRRYLATMAPSAERTAKWILLRDAIISAENISVSDEERETFIAETSAGMRVDESVIREALEKDERFESRMLSDKLMKVLIEYAVVTEVETSADEADTLAEELDAAL